MKGRVLFFSALIQQHNLQITHQSHSLAFLKCYAQHPALITLDKKTCSVMILEDVSQNEPFHPLHFQQYAAGDRCKELNL